MKGQWRRACEGIAEIMEILHDYDRDDDYRALNIDIGTPEERAEQKAKYVEKLFYEAGRIRRMVEDAGDAR